MQEFLLQWEKLPIRKGVLEYILFLNLQITYFQFESRIIYAFTIVFFILILLFHKTILNEHGAACNFIKKETLAQLFPCEFCEISKTIFFYRTPLVAAFLFSSSFFKANKTFQIQRKLTFTIINIFSESASGGVR